MFETLFKTSRIDVRLSQMLSGSNLKQFRIFTKSFPLYRFVDIYKTVERYVQQYVIHEELDSENGLDLNAICNSRFYGAYQAKLAIPSKVPREVDHHDEQFFPTDRFWVAAERPGRNLGFKAILRVKLSEYTNEVILEIATNEPDRAESISEELVKLSIEHSIYRNKLLQISFDSGIKDEYGNVDTPGQVKLSFRKETAVAREDIVLDENIKTTLQRNIFDFHARRDMLKEHGVPLRKGVLFFGPPGTGKTFTCQYIYSELRPVTTLVVTGQSLLQVKSICNLARMLQPSLLVLEDVDLIFTSREINLYSTALGDLMDEMDGFQKDDSVIFLLTTNAIERLEEAIKDRPGRINQCIYFGHPNAELRERYILRYLRPYQHSDVELSTVVDLTKGCSQAFIKELIFRAVQISLEDVAPDSNEGETTISLSTQDFEVAHREMTSHTEHAAGSIMGFRVSD